MIRYFLLFGAFVVVIRILGAFTLESGRAEEPGAARTTFLTGLGIAFLIGLFIFALLMKRL